MRQKHFVFRPSCVHARGPTASFPSLFVPGSVATEAGETDDIIDAAPRGMSYSLAPMLPISTCRPINPVTEWFVEKNKAFFWCCDLIILVRPVLLYYLRYVPPCGNISEAGPFILQATQNPRASGRRGVISLIPTCLSCCIIGAKKTVICVLPDSSSVGAFLHCSAACVWALSFFQCARVCSERRRRRYSSLLTARTLLATMCPVSVHYLVPQGDIEVEALV